MQVIQGTRYIFIVCPCGEWIRPSALTKHLKSKKHYKDPLKEELKQFTMTCTFCDVKLSPTLMADHLDSDEHYDKTKYIYKVQ